MPILIPEPYVWTPFKLNLLFVIYNFVPDPDSLIEISDNLGISQARFYLCDSYLKSKLIM